MKVTQRSVMQALFVQHGGDYGRVIQAYVEAERAGRVPRKTLVMSPETYADLLWRDGVGRGWLDASKTDWSVRTLRTPGEAPPKPTKQAHTLPTFDAALREMGDFWRDSPLRPRPSADALAHWSELIREWIADLTMPLLVRKGTLKALRRLHPEGRDFVSCDNSPAHWAFMGAFLDERPTLDDVRDQLAKGRVPMAMARTREETRRITVDGLEPLGGFLGGSHYGSVSRFPNGISYKLCHLDGIGLKSRGEVEDFPLLTLEAHMRRLVNPTNMIVVPLEYAGVGECAAFLAPFL